jgi:hypothetical protein
MLDDSPLSASTDVLQYSADGQIAVVTRGAIFIVVGAKDVSGEMLAHSKLPIEHNRHRISLPLLLLTEALTT